MIQSLLTGPVIQGELRIVKLTKQPYRYDITVGSSGSIIWCMFEQGFLKEFTLLTNLLTTFGSHVCCIFDMKHDQPFNSVQVLH